MNIITSSIELQDVRCRAIECIGERARNRLAVQSIGERARNRLAFEYWIPQLFTGYLISGLQTNAYNIYSAYNDKSDIS